MTWVVWVQVDPMRIPTVRIHMLGYGYYKTGDLHIFTKYIHLARHITYLETRAASKI